MSKGLSALKAASFDWVMRLDDVWRDQPHDVPEFNAPLRRDILDSCSRLGSTSPLGRVILGPAGAGKTHLLSSLRREAQEVGAFFILVDMTDVKDFWETLLLGFLSSLREPAQRPQGRLLLVDILTHLGLAKDKSKRYAALLAKLPRESLIENTNKVIQALGGRYRRQTIEHQDTIRALFLLNSDDFNLGNLGYTYILGLGLDDAEAKALGFRQPRPDPIKLLRGLSWTISLRGPTLLALDQLDAIVSEQHLAAGMEENGDRAQERRTAKMIIEGLGRGLSALADHTTRTICLVSCLESTWDILRRTALRSSMDRYELPRMLRPVSAPDLARNLVARRMGSAFRAVGLRPPYPTWPFKPEAFENVVGLTPREILKRCEAHRRKCLETGKAGELTQLSQTLVVDQVDAERPEFTAIDQLFAAKRAEAPAADLLTEDFEDDLGQLLQGACRGLIREAPVPDDVDVLLETQFGGGKSYTPLHARLCLIFIRKGAEETHICFRVLQKSNHTAYRARLTAAMTAAGIDRHLSFRRLFIIRQGPPPDSPKCKDVTEAFLQAGGLFAELTLEDVRTLWALANIEENPPAMYDEWQQNRRPVSRLALMPMAVPEIGGPDSLALQSPRPDASTPAADSSRTGTPGRAGLTLGRSLDGPDAPKTMILPIENLTGHLAILAGNSQSILVKRLVEGATLAEIPSLIIDTRGDLCRLGDKWPSPPKSWLGGESKQAQAFHDRAEVRIFTPGQPVGRPWTLPLLPGFRIAEDRPPRSEAEIEGMVKLATNDLLEITAGKGWGKAARKKDILAAALRYLGRRGGGGPEDLLNILDQIPAEVAGKHKAAPGLAREMAGLLRQKLKNDRWLDPKTTRVDFWEVLGQAARPERTKISILSLVGLDSLEERRKFLGLLATALIAWLRDRPDLGATEVGGLLVMDETREILPADRKATGREAWLTLASLCREYGLGLVLATRYPKEVDLEALKNCATWFLGPAQGAADARLLKKTIEARGGYEPRAAKLDPGQFILSPNGSGGPPTRIAVPMCLSHHLDAPPSPEEIWQKAQERVVGG